MCPCRSVFVLPIDVQMFVDGSYNSALEIFVLPKLVPPTTKTLPFVKREAVCPNRISFKLFVDVQVPVDGSYRSAVFKKVVILVPPTAKTFPFDNTVAVCPVRGLFIEPVNDHP